MRKALFVLSILAALLAAALVSSEGRVFVALHPEGHPSQSVVEIVDGKPIDWPRAAEPLTDGLSFGPEDWLDLTDSAIPDLMMRSKAHVRASAPFHVCRFRTGVPGTPGR